MQKLLGELKKGLIFIVSAPSGTGKTTLVQKLLDEFPTEVVRSISCTTRPPRGDERDGVDYYFISQEEFDRRKSGGDFLESVQVFDHQYGTPLSKLRELTEGGKHVVLVIDVQGAMKIKGAIDATYIFISPPSYDVLEKRLRGRSTEGETQVEERLEWARKEMSQRANYDYLVVNEELEIAYQALRSIVIATEKKNRK